MIYDILKALISQHCVKSTDLKLCWKLLSDFDCWSLRRLFCIMSRETRPQYKVLLIRPHSCPTRSPTTGTLLLVLVSHIRWLIELTTACNGGSKLSDWWPKSEKLAAVCGATAFLWERCRPLRPTNARIPCSWPPHCPVIRGKHSPSILKTAGVRPQSRRPVRDYSRLVVNDRAPPVDGNAVDGSQLIFTERKFTSKHLVTIESSHREDPSSLSSRRPRRGSPFSPSAAARWTHGLGDGSGGVDRRMGRMGAWARCRIYGDLVWREESMEIA